MKRKEIIRLVALSLVACAGFAACADPKEDVWPAVKPEWYAEKPKQPVFSPVAYRQKLLKGPSDLGEVEAGTVLRFAYDFAGTIPDYVFCGEFALRAGRSDGPKFWSEDIVFTDEKVIDLGRSRWRLSFSVRTPLLSETRDYCYVLLVPGGGIPALTGKVRLRRAAKTGWEKPTTVALKDLNGSPEIFVDGKPLVPMWGTYRGGPRGARPMGRFNARHSGMPLTVVNTGCGTYNFESGDDQIGPVCDRAAEAVRRNNPDAYLIWSISAYPSQKWKKEHPDELTCDEHGQVRPYWEPTYSFSSPSALAEMRTQVAKAVRYLESSPYANRILGYRVCSAYGPEWLDYPVTTNGVWDFSWPSRQAFAKWAKERYPQLADPKPTTLREREALDGEDILWDQSKHLMTVAWNEFHAEEVANACLEVCRTVRDVVGDRKLVGAYYGYGFYLNYTGRLGPNHNAFKKVLDSGLVNFYTSPQSYIVRNLGDPFVEMKPYGTIAANGFLCACENDMRTSNSCLDPGYSAYQMPTKELTLAAMRRDLATELCRRHPVFNYPINGGIDYDFPEMADMGCAFRALGEFLFERGAPRRNAEIAYVLGERSITSMPMNTHLEHYPDQFEQLYEKDGSVTNRVPTRFMIDGEVHQNAFVRWGRCGAPVDWVLAEDLKDHLGDYKLYVFAHQFKYDDAFKGVVERLREKGATILWCYAPGWSKGATSSLENMRELTGIEFARVKDDVRAGVTMKDDGRFLGAFDKVTPLFTPLNPDKVIGTYDNGEPGLATFRQGNARVVYSGPWRQDLRFCHSLMRSAGVFVYSDSTDPVEANEKLVMLHARFAGRKTVRLPRKADVVDVFARRIVARDADSFAFDAPLHSTHLFYYGDGADELLGRLNAAAEWKAEER